MTTKGVFVFSHSVLVGSPVLEAAAAGDKLQVIAAAVALMLSAGLTGEAGHHQRGGTHRFSRVAVRLPLSTPGILPYSRREKVSTE